MRKKFNDIYNTKILRQKKLCRILDEPLKHNDEFYQMFNDLTFEIVKKINKIQNDDLIWLQDSKTTQLIDMIDLVDKAYTDFMKYYRNDYKHGPDGNAFVLIAAAGQLGNELGFDQEKITEITEEMKSGDYVELIRVFDKYFGDFVILESNNIDDYV